MPPLLKNCEMNQSSDITIEGMTKVINEFRERQRIHDITHGPIPNIIVMKTSTYNELKRQVPAAVQPEIVSFRGIPVEHYPTSEECRVRAEELANAKIPVMLCEG